MCLEVWCGRPLRPPSAIWVESMPRSPTTGNPEEFQSGGQLELLFEIERFVAAVRRQLMVVVLAVILAAIAGVIFLATRTPLYTSSALVLIDNRHVRPVERAIVESGAAPDLATSVVDSQVEVLRSAKITEAVIRAQGLLNNPLYTQEALPNLLGRAKSWLVETVFLQQDASTTDGDEQSKLLRRVIEHLQKNLDAHRIGKTMVLEISFTAPVPAQAAKMANAYAEAYIDDQLQTQYEATKGASVWLEERLGSLKDKAVTSDSKTQMYKAQHGLISSNGKLINEQQISELNTKLVTARTERAQAQARYKRIQDIIQGHEAGALVSEAIDNRVIQQLRVKYLDVSKRESELEVQVGGEHQTVVSLKNEMESYAQQMFEELARMAEAYRSQVDIEAAKEAALSGELQRLVDVSTTENEALVKLRDLERETEAYRSLYQAYLQRYQESLQQESFPVAEARIITSATSPLKPSYPKKLPMLIVFMVMGGMAGTAAGAFREYRENGFVREEQVKNEVGLECLGIIPLLKRTSLAEDAASDVTQEAIPCVDYKSGKAVQLFQSLFSRTVAIPDASHRKRELDLPLNGAKSGLSTGSPIMHFALDNPFSAFTETLLALKLSADIKLPGTSSKIIGVMSAFPSEGKSVTSKNFASILAKVNAKTLLVDADLRGPQLTRQLAPGAEAGLIDVVIGSRTLADVVLTEERSGLSFLPCVMGKRIPHTSELLASAGMRSLLDQAQQSYHYIIIDLPPFAPVADLRAIAPQIQALAYIVAWRTTPRKLARHFLENNPDLKEKCLGIILNKVDTDRIKLFEEKGSRYYYFNRYTQSYYLEKH